MTGQRLCAGDANVSFNRWRKSPTLRRKALDGAAGLLLVSLLSWMFKQCLLHSLRPLVGAAFLEDFKCFAAIFPLFQSLPSSFEQVRIEGIILSQVEVHAIFLVCFDGFLNPSFRLGHAHITHVQQNLTDMPASHALE